MRSLLPRADTRLFLGTLALVLGACHKAPPPVAPGPPITAEPALVVGAMKSECDALLAAYDHWKLCPNLDEYGRREVEGQADYARDSFEASSKVELDDKSQHAIAIACQRATLSTRAATERCNAGKPPPRNY